VNNNNYNVLEDYQFVSKYVCVWSHTIMPFLRIRCVDFRSEELCKMDNAEEEEFYADYLRMVRHIDPLKLKFTTVNAGHTSVFLLDGNLDKSFS